MKSTLDISVVLPVFNERENLVPLLDELEAVLERTGRRYEIICVDDGSTDGTRELYSTLTHQRAYLRVICLRANTGQTAALDAGFREARGNIIVTMDADRQNDPADIPAMLEMLDKGFDCVVGWRQNRQDAFWLRKLPSRIANYLIRRAWRSKLHDLGCALKVIRGEIAREMRLYGEMHRIIGILFEGMGAKVAEFPVNHRARTAGKSKYNLTRVFKVVLDLTTVWFLQGFRTKPIYIFGGCGTFLIAGSAMLSLFVIWEKIALEISLNRNPLFTLSIFLAVIGTQFIVLGLLAELIIRVLFESTLHRPYSIAARLGFDSESERKNAA